MRIRKFKSISIALYVLICFWACSEKNENNDQALKTAPWQEISTLAKGRSVNFMMWQGSPVINDYINNYVVPTLKEKYNIELHISGGQGPEIVQLVMGEKQAGVSKGQVDMVWINGETFFQLRKVSGLWGPFLKQLPNAAYLDVDDTYITTDFQQPINGMEAPWSINQFAIVYDSTEVENRLKTLPNSPNISSGIHKPLRSQMILQV